MGPAGDLDLLSVGEMDIEGRMPYSSNRTFLVTVRDGDRSHRAIYKPVGGERPLWDFPAGLATREVAAYELSAHLGWYQVPATVVRDGPFGVGSCQWFIDADFSEHYFTLREETVHHDALRRLVAFDIVSNNTDRKGGHCLVDADGRLWAIDNGLSFHAQFKVRTVIWDHAGEPLPDDVIEGLDHLVRGGLPACFDPLLDPIERDAVLARAKGLLELGEFPDDPSGRAHPWPLV